VVVVLAYLLEVLLLQVLMVQIQLSVQSHLPVAVAEERLIRLVQMVAQAVAVVQVVLL